jgi:hypothetical protein
LAKVDDLKGTSDFTNLYYTALHEAPDAITVCIDPPSGKSSLAELPLPPSRNENLLSQVAIASPEVKASEIRGELSVSFNVEGLFVFGYKNDMAPRSEAAIKAIMAVVRTKATLKNQQTIDAAGLFRRSLKVRERT